MLVLIYILATTQTLECKDQSNRCSDQIYTSILCSNTDAVSVEYAAQTCPKACNLCDKYFCEYIVIYFQSFKCSYLGESSTLHKYPLYDIR